MNSFPTKESDVKVYVYYDTLHVRKQYERLIYDLPGFLSALGGSLGLYLGLSCFGVFEGVVAGYARLRGNGGQKEQQHADKIAGKNSKSDEQCQQEMVENEGGGE